MGPLADACRCSPLAPPLPGPVTLTASPVGAGSGCLSALSAELLCAVGHLSGNESNHANNDRLSGFPTVTQLGRGSRACSQPRPLDTQPRALDTQPSAVSQRTWMTGVTRPAGQGGKELQEQLP